jgi:ribosome biogenesis protein BRX1
LIYSWHAPPSEDGKQKACARGDEASMSRKRTSGVAAAEGAPKKTPVAKASSSEESAYPSVLRRSSHTRKKVLVICSRGVTTQFIELVEDVLKLLPHAKKDPKFDKREPLTSVNEIADLAGCRFAVYFEARKMQDLFMWTSAVDSEGPSAKFLVQQIKPMKDLRLTGNCLLGSRPIVSFDNSFGGSAHGALLQSLLGQIFSTPKGHPRSKPFHDHVLHFSFMRGKVVVRHYQVLPPLDGTKSGDQSLVEIGPRFSLLPIRIFAGSFGGETLYANPEYVSPNEARSALKRKSSRTTIGHVVQKEKRRKRINEDGVANLPPDELKEVFL